MPKHIICAFIAGAIFFCHYCTAQSDESDSVSTNILTEKDQHGWTLEPGANAREEIAGMWNCPQEKVHPLQVSGFIKNPFKEKPFMPGYLRYKDGVLYVFDEYSHNVVKFDSNLEYLGSVFEDGYIDPGENVTCLRIDDEGCVVLTGLRDIYFSGENPRKLRNLYGLQRLIPLNDQLLSPNWGWVLSSREVMFDILDYDLKHIKSVGKQMYLISDDDRTTDIYVNVIGDKIYIVPSHCVTYGIMNTTSYDIEEMRLNVGDEIRIMEENNKKNLEDPVNYKRKRIFSDATVLGDKLYAMSAFKMSRNKNYISIIELDEKLKMNNIYYYNYADSDEYKVYVHHMAAFASEGTFYFAVTIRATVEIENSSVVYIFSVK
ncbi:MAG TPA: hypothetical protein VMX35_11560 [Acidobacteriota bacterium]|nr:hypothetical protein [Acidobacteriota bacterium]